MNIEQERLINKVVWFIPFKKFRNSVRELLNYLVENQNVIINNQEKIIENQNIIMNNQSTNLNELIVKLKDINGCYEGYFEFLLKCQQLQYINAKKILLVSHYFGMTGAPLAIFNTAKALKDRGYYVTVIGFNTGYLTKWYYEADIDVFISSKFERPNNVFIDSIKNFDFIFLNTVLSVNLAERIYNKIPYLWRIAEAESIENIFINDFPNIFDVLKKVDNIYAVSKYVADYLSKYNDNVNLLIYGFNDISSNYLNKNKIEYNKVKFCTLSSYERPRKGHDVLINAIDLLEDDVKNRVEFYFIGEGLPNSFPGYDNIHSLGVKLGDDKYNILAECDVLLHPALDDPNPQAVMEGMMMHKPCIITDHVGQKDVIENGVDGFIVEAGNAQQLANLIRDIVNNPSILEGIGEKSYLLYKKYFSFENYISNVISIIEKGIK